MTQRGIRHKRKATKKDSLFKRMRITFLNFIVFLATVLGIIAFLFIPEVKDYIQSIFVEKVRIVRILPNPIGEGDMIDELFESATIKNYYKAKSVNLVGWTLEDMAERKWILDTLGILQPQEEKTIYRNGQPMGMNNDGDIIFLINAKSKKVDKVSYSSTTDGIEILFY